ncbi:hypothetical protein RhiirC2_857949 [Rhizophagus irregularis]|uniref:Uncharacterized protein n=1 Tax=Rhizophagus irregularis TaxID=588596 RepID=A0A2N1M8Z2_9GLOM|nr:hypothetical protein RhiirC2_857949 [Rhizophagus irregularis]
MINLTHHTCISDINSTFTAKLSRINNDLNNKLNEEVNAGFSKINIELNSKLTTEAEKNKARDDDFTKKAQKILNDITTKVNNIEEACHNEFSRINVVIENLQNEINQHYAVVRRTEFDQQSITNDSEAELGNSGDSTSASTNSSSSSSSSGSSNLSGILDITSNIKIRFKQHFDRLIKARNYTFDDMCFSVVVDIRSLGGNIKISTVKNFYNGVSGCNVSTINQINAWVASFNNNAE